MATINPFGTQAQSATPAAPPPASPATPGEIYTQSPWWPYLSGHIDNQTPPDLLGGPITTTVKQQDGPAFWVFPGPRALDPTVFGTPDNPKATEQPALFLGLPTDMRQVAPDGTYQTSVPTPFGDKYAATKGANLNMSVVDATAFDGATTKDQVDFEVTFAAPMNQGQYRVVVKKAAPHGWAYPTGGGVVHNVFLHGVTGWGTHLFPTVFTYLAFWGPGDIYKDDKMIAKNHAVHVMLTEFARTGDYKQAFDDQVNPNNRHLHLQIPPFNLKGEKDPVKTGFMLPNGMEQPFFHVMFPAIQVMSTAGGTGGVIPAASQSSASPATSGGNADVTIKAEDQLIFQPAKVQISANTDVTVALVNEGAAMHNFSIDELKIDVDLPPGQTKQITINAPAGTYQFYCNVPGHRAAGMIGTLTVK